MSPRPLATTSPSPRFIGYPQRYQIHGDKIDKDALYKAALTEVEEAFGNVMTSAQILKLPVR
ncbi:hypothetical protein BK654_01435 [Pseudomonas brassicacearum]|uniref:hypothetical protein n=1 Tax=Pseudomonas brassicacearum TaxID=930166 RepID=UPI000F496F69|nr:hypothetical protein [Pseudomonas brassicacearum]ROM82838.1 hypothetical protein BK654_01435 [Pseudomonas brassicacearum]